MIDDLTVLVADWLASGVDANGFAASVNALLPNIERRAGDPAPQLLAGVYDDVRTDEIVLGQEPPEIPALVVLAMSDAALLPLGAATDDFSSTNLLLAVEYVMLDAAGMSGKRDAGYALKAVRRSLGLLNAATQSVRTSNVSLLVKITQMTERRIGATRGRCALAGVVLARCHMEDLAP